MSNGSSRDETVCGGWLYKGKDLRPLAIILLAATEEFSYLWGRNKVQCSEGLLPFSVLKSRIETLLRSLTYILRPEDLCFADDVCGNRRMREDHKECSLQQTVLKEGNTWPWSYHNAFRPSPWCMADFTWDTGKNEKISTFSV